MRHPLFRVRATQIGAIAVLAVFAFDPAPARADRAGGDHPAVVVQRLHATQGYDYTSKFYPHPAWLWLYAEAPRPMSQHPAVLVWRRHRHEQAELLAAALAAAQPRGGTATR